MKRRQEASAEEIAELLARPTTSIEGAARALGVGPTNLRNAIRRHELALPVISIGGRKVVPTSAIKRLLGIEDAGAKFGRTDHDSTGLGTLGPLEAAQRRREIARQEELSGRCAR